MRPQTRFRSRNFPTRIGAWQGRPSLLDVETERGLGLNDYLLSDYSRADGNVGESLRRLLCLAAQGRVPALADRLHPGWRLDHHQHSTTERLVMATIRLIVSSSKSAVPLNSFTIGSTNAAERSQAKFGRSFTYLPTRSCKIGPMAR